ncbi:MAG: sensor histidine kinase [Actinomycetes bacterium]
MSLGSDILGPESSAGSNRALRRALAWYILWSALVLAVVIVGVVLISGAIARSEATRDAERTARAIASYIVTPLATKEFRAAQPEALQAMQDALSARSQDGSLAHVKVWADVGGGKGQVLYADEPQIIGNTYDMEGNEYGLFGTGNIITSVSDLQKAENVSERSAGELVEVYAGIIDQTNQPLLFEGYISTAALEDDTAQLRKDLLPLTLGALLVLFLATLPLAISLARRVDRQQSERRRLLKNAVDSSDLERRRIAQDLHDGVIQDLAGVGISLSSMSRRLDADADWKGQLDEAGSIVRRDVSSLRTLMTDIYPPDLDDRGLAEAVRELLEQQAFSHMGISLDVDEPLTPSPTTARLAFRVIRESLRNIVKHAKAEHVHVTLAQADGFLNLEVRDDGVGFDPANSAKEGHLGLRLVQETVADVGGRLTLTSSPGNGAHVECSLPL